MMQDYIRTGTYQRAILANLPDFKDKVVLDVGAGSGILSFFAIQAGARKVYAVEASTMAQHAEVSLLVGSISVQLHFGITRIHTLVHVFLCEVTCGESEHAYMPCLSRHAHFCGYEG
jgi:predicted RNA methylase